MKRRKRRRKVSWPNLRLACRLLLVIKLLLLIHSADANSFPVGLNNNQIEPFAFGSEASEREHLLGLNNGFQSISRNHYNNSRQANSLQLDSLLALESGSRLLTIGKAPSASAQQAPYESSPKEARLHELYLEPLQESSLKQNNSQQQLVELYQQQAPSFLTQAPARLLPVGGTSRLPLPLSWPLLQTLNRQAVTSPQATASAWPSFSQHSAGRNKSSNSTREEWASKSQERDERRRVSEVEYEQVFEGGLGRNSSAGSFFPSLASGTNGEDEFERSVAGQQQPAANLTSWAQLLRQAAESNLMESQTVTNRSMVSLVCDTNDMLVRLKFRSPFRGIVSTNLERSHACRLIGTGLKQYEMRISLRECGTRQEQPRLFVNNIRIQFHQSPRLELGDADTETKTIICSYPIRPRAPPPLDLLLAANFSRNLNQSQRIVGPPAQDQVQPARLVHYEPIVLISGLILLSLLLLGLISSAYAFTRRRRKASAELRPARRGASQKKPAGGDLQIPPVQQAGAFLSPPLIQVSGRQAKRQNRNARKSSPQNHTLNTDANPKAPLETGRIRRYSSGLPRGRTEVARKDLKAVSASPNYDNSSPDSSHSLNDGRSSVTTIEIPYSTKNKQQAITIPVQRVPKIDMSVNTDAPASPRPEPPQSASPKVMLKRVRTFSKKVERVSTVVKRRPNLVRKTDENLAQKDKLVQAEPLDAPRMSSLRAKLTSPAEYKRLQEIVRLFDEIIIENRVTKVSDSDQAKRSTLVVYDTRLSPSKYKWRILDVMSEQERTILSDLLQRDEVFRSLIVDSIENRENFRRKLRQNQTYAKKLKSETWDLLEEMVMDKNINSLMEVSQSSFEDPSTKRPPTKRDLTMKSVGSDEESVVREVSKTPAGDTLKRPLDSLSSSSSEAHQCDPLAKPKQPELKTTSTVRVSQFNSSRSTNKEGLTGTLINIDSVTNFKDSKNFSSYTRSSIEHKRTNLKEEEDSLPYMDERSVAESYRSVRLIVNRG